MTIGRGRSPPRAPHDDEFLYFVKHPRVYPRRVCLSVYVAEQKIVVFFDEPHCFFPSTCETNQLPSHFFPPPPIVRFDHNNTHNIYICRTTIAVHTRTQCRTLRGQVGILAPGTVIAKATRRIFITQYLFNSHIVLYIYLIYYISFNCKTFVYFNFITSL